MASYRSSEYKSSFERTQQARHEYRHKQTITHSRSQRGDLVDRVRVECTEPDVLLNFAQWYSTHTCKEKTTLADFEELQQLKFYAYILANSVCMNDEEMAMKSLCVFLKFSYTDDELLIDALIASDVMQMFVTTLQSENIERVSLVLYALENMLCNSTLVRKQSIAEAIMDSLDLIPLTHQTIFEAFTFVIAHFCEADPAGNYVGITEHLKIASILRKCPVCLGEICLGMSSEYVNVTKKLLRITVHISSMDASAVWTAFYMNILTHLTFVGSSGEFEVLPPTLVSETLLTLVETPHDKDATVIVLYHLEEYIRNILLCGASEEFDAQSMLHILEILKTAYIIPATYSSAIESGLIATLLRFGYDNRDFFRSFYVSALSLIQVSPMFEMLVDNCGNMIFEVIIPSICAHPNDYEDQLMYDILSATLAFRHLQGDMYDQSILPKTILNLRDYYINNPVVLEQVIKLIV